MTQIYQQIAALVQARLNCEKSGKVEWLERHTDKIESIIDSGPSGSGIDSGIHIDLVNSKPNRLVIECNFHHMNEVGYYTEWTSHNALITPDLSIGFDIRITGRNTNDIKDYLAETIFNWLQSEVQA